MGKVFQFILMVDFMKVIIKTTKKVEKYMKFILMALL